MKNWQIKRSDLMTLEEWKTFRAYLNRQVERADKRANWTAIQDRAICLLAAWTGLRRSEIADLKQGDLFLRNENPFLVVENGKGGKRGEVLLIPAARALLKTFLRQQEEAGFENGPQMPLFRSQRGKYTGNGIYRVWATAMANAGLPVRSIHKARHLYAMTLYRESGYNLRLVKEQLRHTRITTTEVYTTITDDAAEEALSEAGKVLAG